MSTLYIFQAGSEIVEVKIRHKEASIRSSMTNKKFISINEIFKKKEPDKLLEYSKMTKTLSDKEFADYVINEFKKMGYLTYKQKDVDD